MAPQVLPAPAAFTPAQYLATAGDASPQAELDRYATGSTRSRVSLRADAFSSATAPVPALSDANRAAAAAAGLGVDGLNSWLSRAVGNSSILQNIPIIGPILTGSGSTPAPAPAAAAPAQPTQITVAAPADNTAKTLTYIGVGLGAIALLATVMRRK